MSNLDKLPFRAPQSPNSKNLGSSFSAIKLLPLTDDDYDRILKVINEPANKDKKMSVDVSEDDSLEVSSKNRYQPVNRQVKTNPTLPKVTRKQLPISKASPYFVERPKKQEEVKPLISNTSNNGRRIYSVVYGKDKPYKKHKVFSNDGFLIVMPKMVELRDESKKYIGKVESWDSQFPKKYDDSVDSRFKCAGNLVEFVCEITEEEYGKN